MKTRNLIKSAGRGLVALALPLGLVGCNLQEYHFFSIREILCLYCIKIYSAW